MARAGSIIDSLGGTGKVAERLGLKESTVSGWRVRGIPPARWSDLVRTAAEVGVDGITFETLASLESPELSEARP